MITVAIINETTCLSDAQLTPAIAALQIQVSRDFAKYWGVDAQLVQIAKPRSADAGQANGALSVQWSEGGVSHSSVPPKGAFWLVIANTSDYAGAAGYHDVTPEGLPLGKAFVAEDVKAGRPWTVTVSHELLEMLADPDISTCIETDEGRFVALEICDPCEDNKYGYEIAQVLVSDFVLPGYFHSWRNYPAYDFNQKILMPLTILDGGYLSVFDPMTGRGWRDLGPGENVATGPHARQRVGSRRERRSIPRAQWQISTASPDYSADAKEK